MQVDPTATLKGIIFDLDGTISDTWPPALTAFRASIEEFAQRQFSDEELIALAGPDEAGILRKLFPEHWETCFDRYLESFSHELDQREILFTGIEQVLETLKASEIAMSIVSGKTEKAVHTALDKAGISQYFELVTGGDMEGDRKARDLGITLNRMNLEPQTAAYVGDTAGDIEAAKAVGVLSIGVCWAPTSDDKKLRSAGADKVFGEVSEFLGWIKQFSTPHSKFN